MIHIITACSRPENLPVIAKSIPSECRWLVLLDEKVSYPVEEIDIKRSPFTGSFGYPTKNYAIELLSARYGIAIHDWLYFLDDDNIIHPSWFESVQEIVRACQNGHSEMLKGKGVISWGQLNKDETIRLKPVSKPPYLTKIDTASYMVQLKMLDGLRFEHEYDADGRLFEKIASQYEVLSLPSYLCYYNYLK